MKTHAHTITISSNESRKKQQKLKKEKKINKKIFSIVFFCFVVVYDLCDRAISIFQFGIFRYNFAIYCCKYKMIGFFFDSPSFFLYLCYIKLFLFLSFWDSVYSFYIIQLSTVLVLSTRPSNRIAETKDEEEKRNPVIKLHSRIQFYNWDCLWAYLSCVTVISSGGLMMVKNEKGKKKMWKTTERKKERKKNYIEN